MAVPEKPSTESCSSLARPFRSEAVIDAYAKALAAENKKSTVLVQFSTVRLPRTLRPSHQRFIWDEVGPFWGLSKATAVLESMQSALEAARMEAVSAFSTRQLKSLDARSISISRFMALLMVCRPEKDLLMSPAVTVVSIG